MTSAVNDINCVGKHKVESKLCFSKSKHLIHIHHSAVMKQINKTTKQTFHNERIEKM